MSNDTRPPEQRRPVPVRIAGGQGWEVIGFVAALAAFGILALFGNLPWAALLMLFALYCAALP